jgi:[ribosomal protein S18]-alanine N-acetyltransferase
MQASDGQDPTTQIRPIRWDDGPGMYDLFRRLSPQSRYYFYPHPFNEEAARQWAGRADDRAYVVRVVTDGAGRFLGYTWYHPADEASPTMGLGVADSAQHQGHGKRLIDSLIEEARRRGRQGLRLMVHKDNVRAQSLYSRCGFRFYRDDPSNQQYFMQMTFSESAPAFGVRGMYPHAIPWNLTGLTPDTWSVEDWKWYIRLLQGAGCNLLKLYIWPTQFYHPDDPRTAHNAWRFDVYREALTWARTWGMETVVGFTNNTIPPHVWHANPEQRADEHLYRGIHLCWQRGKRTLLHYQRYLVDTFAPVCDGFLVWLMDPGFCKCPACADYARVVEETVAAQQEILKGRARLHLSLWGLDWAEHMPEWFRPVPDLRRKVMGLSPSQAFLLAPERMEDDLIELADRKSLRLLTMAFYQDPESGLENNNVLPQPRLAETDLFISEQRGKGTKSVIGYRLTPYTQFPADWVLLKKMSRPDMSDGEALNDLGMYLFGDDGRAEAFARGVQGLEQWWQGGTTFTEHRDEVLAESEEVFRSLSTPFDRPMRALADSSRILLELSRFRSSGGGSVDELARRIQDQMCDMPIFQGFVQDQLWEWTRARHFVSERVQWWLQTLLRT